MSVRTCHSERPSSGATRLMLRSSGPVSSAIGWLISPPCFVCLALSCERHRYTEVDKDQLIHGNCCQVLVFGCALGSSRGQEGILRRFVMSAIPSAETLQGM